MLLVAAVIAATVCLHVERGKFIRRKAFHRSVSDAQDLVFLFSILFGSPGDVALGIASDQLNK